MDKYRRSEIINTPNVLTVFRLILVPVVAYFFLKGSAFLAGSMFIVACLTDMLDGFLARAFNMITDFGKLLDPIADKAMSITVIACMVYTGLIPLWVVVVFVVKELIMVTGGAIFYKRNIVVSSGWYGKVATAIIWACVIYLLFFGDGAPQAAKNAAIYGSAAASVISLFMYAADYWKELFKK